MTSNARQLPIRTSLRGKQAAGKATDMQCAYTVELQTASSITFWRLVQQDFINSHPEIPGQKAQICLVMLRADGHEIDTQ